MKCLEIRLEGVKLLGRLSYRHDGLNYANNLSTLLIWLRRCPGFTSDSGHIRALPLSFLLRKTRLARKFETREVPHVNVNVFRKREHLKSTAQHFRMQQRLQFALRLGRISQKRLTPVAARELGDNSRQKMMLIRKSGDAQPVCLRTFDNASPMHRHRDVRFSDLFEWRIQISMLNADLSASLRILVRAAIIDCNHVATLQVRRDLVDALERSLIEHRLINRSLDEDKLVAVETYEFLPSVTDQAYRDSV